MAKIELYKPHPKQLEIHKAINENDSFYYLLNIGRQFGKTILLENQALYWSVNFNGVSVGWVSPIYKQALKSFTSILNAIREIPVYKRANESKLEIEFTNGSSIKFMSGESDDNLRGNTFHYLICDEFAFIKKDTWQYVLRATILVKGRKCLLASTPKGKNHFFDLCNLAKENPRYQYFKGTSFDNPFTNYEELEDIKNTLPVEVWNQEYLAEFIDSATVFKNIRDCIFETNEQTEQTYIGIDIGFINDYTVLTALNDRKELIGLERFNRVDAKELKERIKNFIMKYNNPIAYIELNNQGKPIYDDLLYMDLSTYLQGFKTTHNSKSDIINLLIKAFNERLIKIKDDPVLISELEAFIFKVTSTGVLRFEASSGFHDDTVMSLAIANKCHEENSTGDSFAYSVL